MANENNCSSLLRTDRFDLSKAAFLECSIPYRKDLINQKYFGIKVGRHGKC